MKTQKLTAILAAVALAVPVAPAAAYDEICMRMPEIAVIQMYVDKLNTDEMRAASFRALDDEGGFSFGQPRALETRSSANIHVNETKCVNVSGFLREGDIFRVRVRSVLSVQGDASCRPNYRRRGESFWAWPAFYVQTSQGGRATFNYRYGGDFHGSWCQLAEGEQTWPGCYRDKNILTPGCWQHGPKNRFNRLADYIGANKNPYRMAFLLMEDPANNGVNDRLSGGETALHRAVRLEDDNFTYYLLRNGADQSLADNRDETPLHVAVAENRPDNIRWLMGFAETAGNLSAVLGARDRDGRTPVHSAIHRALDGDWESVLARLLVDGAHLDITDNSGETPLHTATREDHPVLALALLTAGADASTPHAQSGETPLDMATRLGTLKSAAALLNHNAPRILTSADDNPADAVDENGQTALHRAAADNDANQIVTLLRLGADPNIRDEDGDIALISALKAGHTEPIRYLLGNNGANPALPDNRGDTALHWAARLNMHRVAAALVDEIRFDMNARNTDGQTPLDVASLSGSVEAAAILIRRNAPRGVTTASDNPANGKDGAGNAPLHHAVLRNDPARIAQLMQLRPDLEIRNRQGETPLLLALRLERGDDRVISPLLAAGARMDSADNNGATPLHRAARLGNMEVLQSGLSGGADANLRDNDGATPLHWAFTNRVLGALNPAIAFLMENGADPTLSDDNGVIILHEAAKQESVEILEAVAARGVNLDAFDNEGSSALHHAIRNGQRYAVRILLDAGADPELRDTARGFTALHWAAHPPTNLRALKSIQEYYPDVNLDVTGGGLHETPLMMVAREGVYHNIAAELLQMGADPRVAAPGGETPLSQAAQGDSAEMVAALLEGGADPNFAAPNGFPAHAAARAGNAEIVRLLLEHGADFTRADAKICPPENRAPADKPRDKNKSERSADGCLPEDLALAGGHAEVIAALHESGHWFSPEFIAAMRADQRLTNTALELFGADYNAALNELDASTGETLLHAAARRGDGAEVEELLRRGADPNVVSRYGHTPLHAAVIPAVPGGGDARAYYAGLPEGPSAAGAARGGDPRVLRALLEAGADPNATHKHGRTAIFETAVSGRTDLAEILMNAGADVDPELNENGYTALHAASQFSPQMVRLLIRAGISPDVPDINGYAPIHWALDNRHRDRELVGEIVTMLLNEGADGVLPDPHGRAPLRLAEEAGHQTAAASIRVWAVVNRR